MPKVRPLSERAVAAARRALDDAGVRHAEPIDVESIAAQRGAMVLFAPLTTARGMILRVGGQAIIYVDERGRGSAWSRFTGAHELGHFVLHDLVDHGRQCTGLDEPRGDEAWAIEREASDFAAELLVPEHLGGPLCAVERADVAHVDRLARTFGTSFEMSAIRFVELTMAPCAVVVAERGKVKWALESLTFPGAIAKWRPLHPESIAARLPSRRGADREGAVPGAAWKSAAPLMERAWRIGPERTLSWISHPAR